LILITCSMTGNPNRVHFALRDCQKVGGATSEYVSNYVMCPLGVSYRKYRFYLATFSDYFTLHLRSGA